MTQDTDAPSLLEAAATLVFRARHRRDPASIWVPSPRAGLLAATVTVFALIGNGVPVDRALLASAAAAFIFLGITASKKVQYHYAEAYLVDLIYQAEARHPDLLKQLNRLLPAGDRDPVLDTLPEGLYEALKMAPARYVRQLARLLDALGHIPTANPRPVEP